MERQKDAAEDDDSAPSLDGHGRIGDVDPEAQDWEPYLLGSVEDKAAISQYLKELRRDDLENADIVAAVHMQIHRYSALMRHLFTLITCGLYLMFMPREDQGILLLTRKGRVLNFGMSHLSDNQNVVGYSWKLILNVIVMAAMIWCIGSVLNGSAIAEVKLVVGIVGFLALAVLSACMWGARPRRDCGSDFRQQFNIADLTVGSYSRVDSWCCCFRRRRGHLRLCFGKLYPDAVTMEDGLPKGVPSLRNVVPVGALPPAAADNITEHFEDTWRKRDATGSSYDGFSPSTAFILAALGIIAGVYEYTAITHLMYQFSDSVCAQKVKGCSWEVPNPTKMRIVDDARPPSNYAGCDSDGEQCDVFWRDMAYCSPVGKEVHIDLKLKCADIVDLETLLRPVLGWPQDRVAYKIIHNATVNSLAVSGKPSGGSVKLEKGMILEKIGTSSSLESQLLDEGKPLNWDNVTRRCDWDPEFGKAMLFVLRKEIEAVDLQDSDCDQLQQACMAQNLAAEVNGWWPVSHLFDWTKKRTLCWFQPDLSQMLNGMVFWHQVESVEPGLTCGGPPTQSIRLVEKENETACNQRCQNLEGCKFAFYKPLNESFSAAMWKKARDSWDKKPQDDHNCLLYDECPDWQSRDTKLLQDAYERMDCGEYVSEYVSETILPHSAVETRLRKTVNASECRPSCGDVEDQTCNAYSEIRAGNLSTCTLYGLPGMARSFKNASWSTQRVQNPGIIGQAGEGAECFVKLPKLPSHPDRLRTGTTGQLFRRSDRRYCTGCAKHELVSYIFEWQNFAAICAQFISIFGVSFIFWRARKSQAWRNNLFTGKPMVDFEIWYDSSNPEKFEDREVAYRSFIRTCYHAKNGAETSMGSIGAEKFNKDCWQWSEDEYLRAQGDVKVVPVVDQTFEDYQPSNLRMTECYLDKELMGFMSDEKVMGAWPERRRFGFWKVIIFTVLYCLFIYLVESYLPESFQYGWYLHAKRSIYAILFSLIVCFFWIEYRKGTNGVCVVTNAGRIVQVTRSQPPTWFHRIFSTHGVRIEYFHIGTVILAQIDMHVVPHALDIITEWPVRAGRKGRVTIKAAHGFLQVHRMNGDAMIVFHAMSALVDTQSIEGLPSSPFDETELYHVSPVRDLKTEEEKHVWTREFRCFGLYNDPFNYSALITITDRRSIFVNARMPKPMSCRGICCGPLTCGMCCLCVQDFMSRVPYLTVATLGHNNLQSYASIRERTPPFYPGLLTPVTDCTVSLLPSFMRAYPSGFSVTQRPYGDTREIRTEQMVTLKPTADGKLQVAESTDDDLIVGRVVDRLNGEFAEDITAEGYDEVHLDPGSDVVLESASEAWTSFADESWLAELRKIYDYILKRRAEDEEMKFAQRARAPPPELSWAQRAWASVVGADMLGHEVQPVDTTRSRRTLPIPLLQVPLQPPWGSVDDDDESDSESTGAQNSSRQHWHPGPQGPL